MTEKRDTVLMVVMIVLCAGFIIGSVYVQSKTEKMLESYTVRKEELATRQQQIQDMILQLNDTIEKQIAQDLSKTGTGGQSQTGTSNSSQGSAVVKNQTNQTIAINTPANMTTAPVETIPAPAPVIIRRTRAS